MNQKRKNRLYSALTKRFRLNARLVCWLWENRKNIRRFEEFDYPHYAGMPDRLVRHFGEDELDLIRERWPTLLQCRSPVQIASLLRMVD